jgi:hypothetical protein
LAIVACCSAPLLAAKAESNVPELSPPYRTVAISNAAPAGTTAPFFNHGYLIQFKHKTEAAGESNIFLYSASGELKHEVAIWPEGTATLFLASVDVGASKQMAYSYRQTNNDDSTARFIALSDLDGKNEKIVNTGTYLATQIALASDGSIWTIGAEYFSDSGGQRRWDNYDMLRHYSAKGALLEHFLPRWEPGVSYKAETPDGAEAHNNEGAVVTDNTPPGEGYNNAWRPSRQTYLRSTGSSTVLYDGLNDRVCLHHPSSKTLSCQSITGDNVDEMGPNGFAISDNGEIFASMRAFTPDKNERRSMGLFVLSRLASGAGFEWKAVPGPIVHAVLGEDGGFVVYRGPKYIGSKAVNIYWARPQ